MAEEIAQTIQLHATGWLYINFQLDALTIIYS